MQNYIESLKKFNAPQTYFFNELSSTMDIAKEIISDNSKFKDNLLFSGRPDQILVIAGSQTTGRGRAGREWYSPEQGGLYFTYADLRPRNLDQTLGLSLAVGASICENLKQLGVPLGLKWPNDLIYFPIAAKEAKKVGGVLIETIVSGSETKAVFIGVGLNVNTKEFPSQVPGISLSNISSRELTIESIFDLVIPNLVKDMEIFFEQGFSAFKNTWRKHSLMFGSKMSVKTEEESFDCIVEDVADDGAMLVKFNNEVKALYSAEFQFIGPQKSMTISQTIDSYIADFFTEISEEEKNEILESINDPVEKEEDLVKEAETGSKNINAVIKDLKLGQKIKLAMLGNMGARSILIRENSRQIRQAVMKNPRITENEVFEFAKNANLDKHVFQMIGNDNNWMKSYPIQVAIVSNPKTPMEISIRWIKYLKDKELRDLSKSKNIPSALSTQIRKLLETRNKKPGGSGH